MLTFEQAAQVLDRAMESLPKGIYDQLNGGVNLIDETRRAPDGRYTMGLYHHDKMGRYIEIFYGSFCQVFGKESDDRFSAELVKTLHHELTHHVENKAGDRTLERWDQRQAELWAMGEPLEADSILFVGGGDGILSESADVLFRRLAADAGLGDMPSACADTRECDGALPIEALRAAKNEGAELSRAYREPMSDRTVSDYGVVLCMTEEQCQTLSRRYPRYSEKIMTLGEKDIAPPRARTGWGRVMRSLRKDIESLIDELCYDGDEE